MTDLPAQSPYPYGYRLLHTAIAVLVVTLFTMQYARRPFGEAWHAPIRELHKSLGLVLLALIVLRVVLRLRMPAPPRYPDTSLFREIVASLVHWTLWGLMIAVPLLGVTFLLAQGRGVDFFGTGYLGPLTSGSPYWGALSLVVHRSAAIILIAFVVLHGAAALMHKFVLRDGLLARMSLKQGPSKETTRSLKMGNDVRA